MLSKRLIIIVATIFIGIVLVSLSVSMTMLISGYYDATFPKDDEFAIVFDAGSSSTKMYIYTWNTWKDINHRDKIKIHEIAKFFKSPGIDKITSQSDMVFYFNESIKLARQIIPVNRRSRTLITLAATAGMRLLEISNKTQTDLILDYIRDYFSTTEFFFSGRDHVKIISGNDEAVFAWVSTNYFLDIFSVETNPKSTYGILDLGGASSQIAFIPENNQIEQSAKDHFTTIKIYGINYNTYSGSLLCYGVDQIMLVYSTFLIIKNNYKSQIKAPCFNLGSSYNVSSSSILKSNCANGLIFKYAKNLNKNLLAQKDIYVLHGTSRPDECESQVRSLFPNTTCNFADCSLKNEFLPPASDTIFYAFSNFFYKINNTEILSNKILKKDMNEYRAQTNHLCSLTFKELVGLNKGSIAETFLKTTCFFNYYVLIMYDLYKISNLTNVEIRTDIDGNTVGWSLGYLFTQINRDDFLPREAPVKKLPFEFFVPAIIIASSLSIFLIFALTIYICIIIIRNSQ